MKKVLLQGSAIVILFFSTWMVLTQVDWVGIFKIQKVTDQTEEKVGELFWQAFSKTEKENKNPVVVNSVDSIINRICTANKIDRKSIKVHIFEKDEINAFALPNGHLIVYSGLILNSENQEELSGVLCHEIAHIELNHVMKKLVQEVGLSVLISMTTGNGGAAVTKEAVKALSSTAFDRSLEKEADIKAVDYLIQARINPTPFANFLYKLSSKEDETSKYFTWISTHPESKERAVYIAEYSKGKTVSYKAVLTAAYWDKLKKELKGS